MSKRLPLFAAIVIVATTAFAQPVEEKGFVYVTGEGPVIRKEPKADAGQTAVVPAGGRLVYRKVVKGDAGVEWYLVDMPGAGTGWLAAQHAAAKRPTAPPALRPVKAAPPPAAPPSTTTSSQTSAARGLGFARSASAQTAGSRGLGARTLSARGVASVEAADKIVQKASVDYITMERVVGIQMKDPPHPDGRYADVTATGRKADAEAFAKQVKEGE